MNPNNIYIDGRISFLDLILQVNEGVIILDWFQKETFSGRILSFYSNHPNCHKIGTIYNLIDRATLLSHPKFHQKNIELCIKILRDNGYPLTMIFDTIQKRIKKLIRLKLTNERKKLMTSDLNGKIKSDEGEQRFFVIPYVRNISEITASLFNKSNFTVGFRILNKMDKIVRVQKDQIEYTQKRNVVYRIGCNNCEVTYTGQTKRQLKTRIKEHCNNRKLDCIKHSVITEHMLKYSHEFDWSNVKILDTESNYNKRLVSEMLHIKEQVKGINSQKDTEYLNDSYYELLYRLSNQQ